MVTVKGEGESEGELDLATSVSAGLDLVAC